MREKGKKRKRKGMLFANILFPPPKNNKVIIYLVKFV